jgi:hypothetical protein
MIPMMASMLTLPELVKALAGAQKNPSTLDTAAPS